MITSTFLVFSFSVPAAEQFKYIWWVLMMSLLCVRLIDWKIWTRPNKAPHFDGKKAVYRFVFGANLTAIMWSIYVVTVIVNSNTSDINLSAHLIIVSAMAGGSATVLAGHKPTAIFFSFVLLVPASLALIASGIQEQRMLGILGLLFGVVMVAISKKTAVFTAQAMLLKNQNAVLVHEMEEQVEQRTQTIYQLSNLDPLTGLFNRTAFLKHLKLTLRVAQQQQQPLAVLFIDLDGFKKINDAIGHDIGDQVLTQTAQRLKHLPLNSKLLCRWGGDEFVMAVENCDELAAKLLGEELIDVLSAAYTFENNRFTVGATVGVALCPQHSRDGHSLIRLADTAMYAQKKRAPSYVGVYSKTLEKRIHRELTLKDGLSEAIELNQFHLLYQPIVRASDCHVVSFEALLRWTLNQENIPPDEFIAIAEQYGQIRHIGAWVLEQACKTASLWPKHIAVCVNVSVVQLQDDDFVALVVRLLERYQLSAERLHIEMTESVFTSDISFLSEQIQALQDLGVKVSIDDFGTGYSSLSSMQDLAVDTVKIDRSFVNNIDSNGHAIITAVMQIAKALDYSVVAEGIETQQQLESLRQLNVDYLQGYYFAKPLTVQAVQQLLSSSAAPKLIRGS